MDRCRIGNIYAEPMIRFGPEYNQYVKSERWALKREIYFAKKGKWCKACLTRTGPIALHHMSYVNFGREPISDLIGLCHKCHREVHSIHRRNGRREDLRAVTLEYVRAKTLDRLRKRR